MKSIWQTALVAVLGALVGGAAVFGALNYHFSHHAVAQAANGQTQDDNFFGAHDPFAQMRKMQTLMEKNMMPSMEIQMGDAGSSQISQREDKNFVYYDIKVDDPKSTSVKSRVEDGYVIINGSTEKKSDGSNSESVFQSSFSRTFPLPDHVDQNKMEMMTEGDKIVLRFPKIKA